MSDEKLIRPEWFPEDDEHHKGFTTNVMSGIESRHDGMPGSYAQNTQNTAYKPATHRRELSIDEYVDGVLSGDRATLARAITLVESNADRHQEMAQEMLSRLLPHAGHAIRVGITGVPGTNKSSLIEMLGLQLCEMGHRDRRAHV